MRKLFLLCFFALLFVSCDFNGDDSDSLPSTDNSLFITENGFKFPEGTSALELYNCLYERYGEGQHNDISGKYSRIESALYPNGDKVTRTITANISSVYIYTSRTEISNLFHVDFTTDKADVDKKLQFCYQWQFHNTNAWTNNTSDGEIIIYSENSEIIK